MEDKLCWMKTKKEKQINTKDIGLQGDGLIFINHDLTKRTLELFEAAKEYLNTNCFKYVWVSNYMILMRKNETSKIELIQCESNLKN